MKLFRDALETMPTMSLPADRRAASRFGCQLETACRSLQSTSNIAYPATIHNLSTGGLALKLARRFEAGTLLLVRLENPDKTVFFLKLVQVRHQRANTVGWYHGCTFPMQFSPEQLEALL
ncbi:MAG: PilZ domain-containing protein [Planctomycetia bacterium]|nr:PilZ domain-containing protein [Planctomycetia bacterium]